MLMLRFWPCWFDIITIFWPPPASSVLAELMAVWLLLPPAVAAADDDDKIVTVFWPPAPGANCTVTALPPIVRPFCGIEMICWPPGVLPAACTVPMGRVKVIGLPLTLPRIILTPPPPAELPPACTADVFDPEAVATDVVPPPVVPEPTSDTKLLPPPADVTIFPVWTVRMAEPPAVVTKMIDCVFRMVWPCLLVMTNAGLPAAFVVILPTCMMLEFFIRILLPLPDGPVISLTTLPPIMAVLAAAAAAWAALEVVAAPAVPVVDAVTETAADDVCCLETTCMPWLVLTSWRRFWPPMAMGFWIRICLPPIVAEVVVDELLLLLLVLLAAEELVDLSWVEAAMRTVPPGVERRRMGAEEDEDGAAPPPAEATRIVCNWLVFGEEAVEEEAEEEGAVLALRSCWGLMVSAGLVVVVVLDCS